MNFEWSKILGWWKMPNEKKVEVDSPEELEELIYETRFLLNVLIDLLAEKKVISEDELYKKYDQVLSSIEKEKK